MTKRADRGPAPKDWSEWEPEIAEVLWAQIDTLNGAQIVAALKTIKDLAEMQRAREGDPDEPEVDIYASLDALPYETAHQILAVEIDRHNDEHDQIAAALDRLHERAETEAVAA